MMTTKTSRIVQIEAEELEKYSPVNETLSAEFIAAKPEIKGKVFCAADLWKLRRQRKLQGLVIR